ncbi:MAG: hypothetical protein ABIP63_01615, partial [Thermoanaerobaculia bacterium]
VPITGAQQPVVFWSPDSRWIAFISDHKLWKIATGGSAPVLIAPLSQIARGFHSGAWGADDRIVLAALFGGLYEVSARGGRPVEALAADAGLVDFHNLSFLPDGRTLLAVPHKLENMASVEVIRGKNRQTIATFDAMVRDVVYSPTGHLLVSRRDINAGLWAMPFSTETMTPTGKEFLVAAGAGACTASSDGSLSYVVNIDYGPKQIVRVDGKGKIIAKIGDAIDTADHPILSPDEKTLAISARQEDNSSGIELVDSITGTRRQMTHGFVRETPASWSHDGRQLVAHREPTFNWSDPRFGVWLVPAYNTGEPRRLAAGWEGSFTPDDRNVVFLTLGLREISNIVSVPVRGGAPVVMMKSPFQRGSLALSPDGHLVAYRARESESLAIYVTRYPSGEGKWQVSPGEAGMPTWSGDGRTLYYASGNRLMSASVGQSSEVVVGPPVMLFDATPFNVNLDHGFQVLRDGSMIAIQDLPPDKRQVVLVQNWLAEFSEDEKH